MLHRHSTVSTSFFTRYRSEVVEREKVCGLVGVTLTAAEIAKLLSKMCLKSKALGRGTSMPWLRRLNFKFCFYIG